MNCLPLDSVLQRHKKISLDKKKDSLKQTKFESWENIQFKSFFYWSGIYILTNK